jgi:HAD superfamily hydrolase (TIGR01509 family)
VPLLRAVLFDLGHTLVYRKGESEAVVDEAAALGVVVERAVADELWSRIQLEARTQEAMAKGRDLSEAAHRREWLALYEPAEELAVGLATRLYERERDPGSWMLYPDVVPVLDALTARGVPLGIVSDTGWDYSEVLARAGLRDRFGSVVMSFEHGLVKPDGRLFTTACTELGVTPAETLMVGDNHVPDGGAVAAGLTVLLLPPVAAGAERGLHHVLELVDGCRAGLGT